MTPLIHLSTLFVLLGLNVSPPILSPRRRSWLTPMARNRRHRCGREDGEFQKTTDEINGLGDCFKIAQRARLQLSRRARSRPDQLPPGPAGRGHQTPRCFPHCCEAKISTPLSHAGAVEMPADGATVTSSEVRINPQRLSSEVCMTLKAALDSLHNNYAKLDF